MILSVGNAVRLLLLSVLAGGMTACVSSKVTRIHYKGLNIRVATASASAVDAHCRKVIKRNDRGEAITRRIRCCTIHKINGPFIWMSQGDEDCLAHELCHAEGRRLAKECDDVHPERFH